MVSRLPIVQDRAAEGGSSGTRRKPKPEKIPGAHVSPESVRQLHKRLDEVDAAQHVALANGDRYYLGVSR